MWGSRWYAQLFHMSTGLGPLRAVRMGRQRCGGACGTANIADQASRQGQFTGRRSASCPAPRTIRAGTRMSWSRRVPVVALAWNVEARAPSERAAVAVSTEQLALALYLGVGVEAFYAAHEQAGGDLLLLRLGRERGVVADLGDLRIRDPALPLLVPERPRVGEDCTQDALPYLPDGTVEKSHPRRPQGISSFPDPTLRRDQPVHPG